MRRNLSLPEGLLWRELRRSPQGIKFRRQHPVGEFVIDFYCAGAKLGIEVDGIVHDMGNRPERDLARDAFLTEQGIAILRIPASDVLKSPIDVAYAILALCYERSA